MNRVLKALRFSEEKHKGQKRNSTGDDYIVHPIFTSYLIVKFKNSKHIYDLVSAAILHDILEDTDTTQEELVKEFGLFISSLVLEVTNDEKLMKKMGKLEYQKKKVVGISNYGLIIKLCDRLSNIYDKPWQKYIKQTIELLDYLESNRKLTKTQKEIVDEIRQVMNKLNLKMEQDKNEKEKKKEKEEGNKS